jgi:tRNA dimethylallyltransferase
MATNNKTLITVVGPTAIGKTSLSIALAKHFQTEIISCDSRQFYKEMTIGTAVPKASELAAVPHHFIQNKRIFNSYNVGDFEKEALQTLELLFAKKNIVIMVGGSGLYVDAVLKGFDQFPQIAPTIREELNIRLKTEGLESLQNQLKKLDPVTFSTIAIHNPQRVTRALEICIGSGLPYSSFKNNTKKKRYFNTIKVGLNGDRQHIYHRINLRVDQMIADGLIQEAEKLHQYKHLNALQTVGYRELFAYFEGNTTKEEAIEEIKKNTRRFAKRQLTWFRKDSDILWFDYQLAKENIIQEILKQQHTL